MSEDKGINAMQHHQTFESIKKTADEGEEYWLARDLQGVLDYSSWDKFERVLKKAIIACSNSGQSENDHFSQVGKMVPLGSGAQRETKDYKLSRYACYLIVQNADSSKPVIANGQTYFAVQTRRQELQNDSDFGQLQEDEQRLLLRNELKTHNKQLVEAAAQAGVENHIDFAIFQNHGYKGLYGGLGAKEIHTKKQLKKSHKILDHMGSTELAANLFRATQAEDKLKRDQVQSKRAANKTHYDVGQKIRETIKSLGGTMPEELPTPKKSVLKIKKEQKRLARDNNDE